MWLDRLEANQDNIRFALAWLADHDIESALEMGAALWRFWHRRGHLREGAAQLRALLERPAAAALTRSRARALLGLAGITYWQLDYVAAKKAYEEALAIARSLGDEPLEADIAYSLAYTRALDGDLAAAQQSTDEAAAMYGRLGDEMGVASTVMVSSMLAELRGERELALRLMDEVIPKFERGANDFLLLNTIGMKLRVLVEIQRFDEARALDVRYLKMALEQNELTSLSAALMDAASLEALAGQTERAARLYGAGQRAVDDAGGQAPPELRAADRPDADARRKARSRRPGRLHRRRASDGAGGCGRLCARGNLELTRRRRSQSRRLIPGEPRKTPPPISSASCAVMSAPDPSL